MNLKNIVNTKHKHRYEKRCLKVFLCETVQGLCPFKLLQNNYSKLVFLPQQLSVVMVMGVPFNDGAFQNWCQNHYVNPRNMKQVASVRNQLSEICTRLHLTSSDNTSRLTSTSEISTAVRSLYLSSHTPLQFRVPVFPGIYLRNQLHLHQLAYHIGTEFQIIGSKYHQHAVCERLSV